MCLGIPGQVVEILPDYGDQLALVDVQGAQRRINLGLLEPDQEALKASPWSASTRLQPRRRSLGWN